MAGGYCIEWSAWRVWLHPHRALDAINEAEAMENDYEKRLEEALALIGEQKKECARLTNEVSELSRRCVANEAALSDTRRRLSAALDELADHESVDKKIAEFNKMLEGVEEMKRNYEKRIRTLEARLRDEKKRSGRDDASDILEPIDMKAKDHYKKPAVAKPENIALHFEEQPKQRQPRIVITDDKPIHTDDGKRRDSDDWLLELPPDL